LRLDARKVWKTVPAVRRAVALARAAIHSPNDAATGQPNPGQAPGRPAELVNAKIDGPAGSLVPPCATTQRVAVPRKSDLAAQEGRSYAPTKECNKAVTQ
jgi:hypothetical protein